MVPYETLEPSNMANHFRNKREIDHLVLQILKAINANQRHYGSTTFLMVLGRIGGEIRYAGCFRERNTGWGTLKSHFLGKKGYLTASSMIQSDAKFYGKY